jgi:hypothetical protein
MYSAKMEADSTSIWRNERCAMSGAIRHSAWMNAICTISVCYIQYRISFVDWIKDILEGSKARKISMTSQKRHRSEGRTAIRLIRCKIQIWLLYTNEETKQSVMKQSRSMQNTTASHKLKFWVQKTKRGPCSTISLQCLKYKTFLTARWSALWTRATISHRWNKQLSLSCFRL